MYFHPSPLILRKGERSIGSWRYTPQPSGAWKGAGNHHQILVVGAPRIRAVEMASSGLSFNAIYMVTGHQRMRLVAYTPVDSTSIPTIVCATEKSAQNICRAWVNVLFIIDQCGHGRLSHQKIYITTRQVCNSDSVTTFITRYNYNLCKIRQTDSQNRGGWTS